MAKAAILAFTALALLGAAPDKGPPVLDPIFKFTDPARCTPSPLFRQILDRMTASNGLGGWGAGELVLPLGYEDVLAYHHTKGDPQVPIKIEIWGNNGRHDIRFGIQGSWHGLPLHSISVWGGPPSKRGLVVELGFDAEPERVAERLSAMGFPHDLDLSHGEARASLMCRFK